jgi:KEOPS complex subunit Cgi121
MIEVFGAEGGIESVESFIKKLSNLSTKHRVVIQALDAEMIYGRNHLLSAAEHAIRSFREGRNVTKSLALEILLYAGGVRQIEEAVSKMGVKRGSRGVSIVVVHSLPDLGIDGNISIDKLLEELGLRLNNELLKGNERKIRNFGISEEELSTVGKDKYEDLILEKVAMVDVIK